MISILLENNSHSSKTEKLLVSGNIKLQGSVKIAGAKNAVLKQMAASLLIPAEITLKEVPALQDVFRMLDILKFLGVKCQFEQKTKTLTINATHLSGSYAPFELVSRLRASFVVLGPILSRMGTAKVSLPGGCQIGKRSINLHEQGLRKLGAEIKVSNGYVEALCTQNKLQGENIHLNIPSNGATENLMMAAVLAKGITTIQNAAKDPEIADLANFLNACGAKISGAGSSTLQIEGVELDSLHGCEYTTLPDRIEAGTFLLAGLATGGIITVENTIPAHLKSLVHKLQEMGGEINCSKNAVQISATGVLKAVNLITAWYPGFSTDLQAQFMAVLTKAEGSSIIQETIYEDRFAHAYELSKMGADIKVNHNVAVLKGVDKLSPSPVIGSDLRATAGLVIAGLMTEGTTEVYGLNHLDRGYSQFAEKLNSLGAQIQRVSDA